MSNKNNTTTINSTIINEKFEKAFSYLLSNEGYFVENPQDAGGATQFGISLRFFERLSLGEADLNHDMKIDQNDIKLIDIQEAKKIYKKFFWDLIKADKIKNPIIAIKCFDTAVDIGVKKTVKFMQEALNYIRMLNTEKKLLVDGVIGIHTLDRLNMLSEKQNKMFLHEFIDLLQIYYKSINTNTFIHGWLIRAKKLPDDQ
jgi:lysozyme family protein